MSKTSARPAKNKGDRGGLEGTALFKPKHENFYNNTCTRKKRDTIDTSEGACLKA